MGAEPERPLRDLAPAEQVEERAAAGSASTKPSHSSAVPGERLDLARDEELLRRDLLTAPAFPPASRSVNARRESARTELAEQPAQRAARCGAGSCTGASARWRPAGSRGWSTSSSHGCTYDHGRSAVARVEMADRPARHPIRQEAEVAAAGDRPVASRGGAPSTAGSRRSRRPAAHAHREAAEARECRRGRGGSGKMLESYCEALLDQDVERPQRRLRRSSSWRRGSRPPARRDRSSRTRLPRSTSSRKRSGPSSIDESVRVAVTGDLVAAPRDLVDELRPALGDPAEDEERRAHAVLARAGRGCAACCASTRVRQRVPRVGGSTAASIAFGWKYSSTSIVSALSKPRLPGDDDARPARGCTAADRRPTAG